MFSGWCLRAAGWAAVPVVNIAGALVKLGRKDEAVEEYRRALLLDPAEGESAANLAQLLRGLGDGAGALRVLDQAIAAGCHASAVFLERGVSLAESGRIAEALESVREAARRDPSNPVPLEDAARAAYRLERYDQAARLYEGCLELAPGRVELWKTLGSIYVYRLDDHGNGLRAFRQALRLERDPAEREKLEELVQELAR